MTVTHKEGVARESFARRHLPTLTRVYDIAVEKWQGREVTLRNRLLDDQPGVRSSAALELAKLAFSTGYANRLQELTYSQHQEIRLAATIAFLDCGVNITASFHFFSPMLEDPNSKIRHNVAWGLRNAARRGHLRDFLVPEIEIGLKDESWDVKVAVAEACILAGRDEGIMGKALSTLIQARKEISSNGNFRAMERIYLSLRAAGFDSITHRIEHEYIRSVQAR